MHRMEMAETDEQIYNEIFVMVEKIRDMKGNSNGISFEKLERKLKRMQAAGKNLSLTATKDVIVDFFEGVAIGGGSKKKRTLNEKLDL